MKDRAASHFFVGRNQLCATPGSLREYSPVLKRWTNVTHLEILPNPAVAVP